MGGVFYRSVVSKVVALAFAVVLTAGCSSPQLVVAYSPQGILDAAQRAGVPVALTVVDRIHNTAPLAASNILGVQRTALGAQIICDTCVYQLAKPPVEVVRLIVGDVFARQGTPLASAAAKKVEVQVHQFEFYLSKNSEGHGFQAEGKVGLKVIVAGPDGVSVERFLTETGSFSSEAIVSPGDMQEFVSRTVSAAIERVLSDAKMFAAYDVS